MTPPARRPTVPNSWTWSSTWTWTWTIRLAALAAVLSLAACSSPAPQILWTDILGDTSDAIGPYRVAAMLKAGGPAPAVTLYYSTDGAIRFYPLAMPADAGQPALYAAEIPGQPPGTIVNYFVSATEGAQSAIDPPQTAASPAYYAFEVLAVAVCRVDSDCPPGQLCEAGTGSCHPQPVTCKTDGDCPMGDVCDTFRGGVCEIAVRTCSSDFSCLIGEICDRSLGRCMPRPQCQTQAAMPCPAGFSCNGTTDYCVRQCSMDADCGPGEKCKIPEGCVPESPCSTGAQCPASSCDTTIGGCRGGGALCAVCENDADCGGAHDLCVRGFCGMECPKTDCPASDAGGCPSGYTCECADSPPQCVPLASTCNP